MASANKFLFVGLGNHGFDFTRHNVGMMAVDALANHWNMSWNSSSSSQGFVAQGRQEIVVPSKREKKTTRVTDPETLEEKKVVTISHTPSFSVFYDVVLFKPKRFMNENGKSIGPLVKSLNIPIKNVVALHDDLERDLGKISWKSKGSANGHNGIASMINSLRSNDFERLRIGIGRPDSRDFAQVGKYVLRPFPVQDRSKLEDTVFPDLIKIVTDKLISSAKNTM